MATFFGGLDGVMYIYIYIHIYKIGIYNTIKYMYINENILRHTKTYLPTLIFCIIPFTKRPNNWRMTGVAHYQCLKGWNQTASWIIASGDMW